MADSDERFMARALDLARSAPFTSPNPRVGAVVVRAGRIVSEGVHMGAGTPHAEARALGGVDARGSTLYVNLEPCVHSGRTPPCAPAVAEAGVARVVVATPDPDPRVTGAGLALLRERGVEVTTGVLEQDAERLNAPYLHQRRTGRAFMTLKLALSLDGRMAAADQTSRWITGPSAREHVHRRRLEADAVMVGSGTVALDDPSLTVRAVEAARQPAVVVVDASGSTPPGASIFRDHPEVIVATRPSVPHEAQMGWKEAGAEVVVLPGRGPADGVDLDALIADLGRRGFLEVYCEGGPRLATSLLSVGLVDRLELHHGAALLGEGGSALGDLGVRSMEDAPRWRLTSCDVFGDDVVTTYERVG